MARTMKGQAVLSLISSLWLPKAPQMEPYPVVPLDIRDLFNNQAASINGSPPANFDNRGGSLPSHLLPNGSFHHDGIHVSLLFVHPRSSPLSLPSSISRAIGATNLVRVPDRVPCSRPQLATDNVIADGQVITLPRPVSINALHLLYSGDWIDGQCTCHLGYPEVPSSRSLMFRRVCKSVYIEL